MVLRQAQHLSIGLMLWGYNKKTTCYSGFGMVQKWFRLAACLFMFIKWVTHNPSYVIIEECPKVLVLKFEVHCPFFIAFDFEESP